MPSTTLTVRLPEVVKDKLGELAKHTKRTRSFLAAEAIEDYVEKELAIVQGIDRGLEDMKAGRVVPHDDVMADIGKAVSAARRKQKKR